MSKFNKTVRSKHYWINKGQGKIYQMLKENIKERGDSAKLAKKLDTTPGYVSQILSGESEINPTWKKIVKFCLALNKVPILEIIDIDEFINEESIKASSKICSQHFNNSSTHNDFHQPKMSENINYIEPDKWFVSPEKNNAYAHQKTKSSFSTLLEA